MASSPPKAAGSRDLSIDIVRGLAISIMVPANMSASSYVEPHPDWFRVLSSLAAPTFVLLAGMMVAFGTCSKRSSWQHYVLRGALLLLTAALIDVLIWKLTPFRSFDVLYLVGVSCPLTYFACRLSRRMHLGAAILVILAAPLLQYLAGYADCPSDVFLWGSRQGEMLAKPVHPTGVVHHFFIDGWFPLFPWLGISLSGALIARCFLLPSTGERRSALAVTSCVLLLLGIPLWLACPGPRYVRAGYSEMFYPPTAGFILTSIGFAMAALWLVKWVERSPVGAPLRWLGEASLFMYILHCALINFVIEPRFVSKPLGPFLILNVITLAAMVLIGAGLHRVKKSWPNRPFLFKFYCGG